MVVIVCLLAFMAGCMITVSSIFNAQLSKNLGTYRVVFLNNLMGTITAALIVLFYQKQLQFSFEELRSIPLYIYLGGIITIAVVAGTNNLLPKIPIIFATLFIFIGQFTGGFALDLLNREEISKEKFVGFVLVIAGLIYNLFITKKRL
ncbi:DMT family transporter [Alkaliphilus peptidifermentans]|uniref:Transporter family-2 protein n=1 Tax=Alkaliphilus peptidifermentans DSM 18978 TaxID=1120976 RepID=A0A1G5FN29_9FIRM|nr:DMT family transporter [Alkaliphilus peptidifermentans]SCY40230.1 transporter family-2 protein [Alkaliphilus peptidifermentans DSM 18978]